MRRERQRAEIKESRGKSSVESELGDIENV